MKIFKFINKYIFKYKFQLFIFSSFTLTSLIISIAMPYITGNYIDSLIDFHNSRTIINFTMKILFIGIINIVSSFMVSYSYVKIQTKSAIELNFNVLEHIMKMPILHFKNIDSAYLNQRVNSDSNTLVSFVVGNFLSIITKFLTLIFVSWISFNINYKLTLMLIPLFHYI